MTYTQTYTRPFSRAPFTHPSRSTRVTPEMTYTQPYTTYTQPYLHVSHPLLIGGGNARSSLFFYVVQSAVTQMRGPP